MQAIASERPKPRWVRLLELIRFSHTIFALPFAVLAALFALRVPLPASVAGAGPTPTLTLAQGLGLLLCMVFARSLAMAFNRLVDARLDAANPRTRNRHLPAGTLRRAEVVALAVLCAVGFIASCALFWPNWLPLLGAVPVLLFLCGYSLAKRFTAAAHLWLGVALALAPICVWVALRGEAVLAEPRDLLPAVVLALAVAAWVTGFDIIYACQDARFDRRAGLHSIPARLGVAGALRFAAGAHAVMVVGLLLLPWTHAGLSLGWLYAVGLVLIAGLLVYEHRLVRPDDLQRAGVAFFHVNAVVSMVLLLVGGVDCWWV